MPNKPKPAPKRLERDAGTGQYVKKGTEKRRPTRTVTEPVRKKGK